MIAFSKSSKAIISWVSITLFFCAFWNSAWQKGDGEKKKTIWFAKNFLPSLQVVYDLGGKD